MRRGSLYANADRHKDSQADLEAALTLLNGEEPTPLLGRVFHSLGFLAIYREEFGQARIYATHYQQVARDLGDRMMEVQALRLQAIASRYLGNPEEAILYGQQALRHCQEQGDQLGEALVTKDVGSFYIQCGDFATADRYLSTASEQNNDMGQAYIHWHRALLSLHREEFSATCRHTQQILDDYPEIRLAWFRGVVQNLLGHGLLGVGEYEPAVSAYRSALVLFDPENQRAKMMESVAGLAKAALHQGDLTEAMAHVETILTHLSQKNLDGADDRFRVYAVCIQVLQAAKDGRATEVHRDAYSLLLTQASSIKNESLRRSFFENLPSHREIVAWEQIASEHAALPTEIHFSSGTGLTQNQLETNRLSLPPNLSQTTVSSKF